MTGQGFALPACLVINAWPCKSEDAQDTQASSLQPRKWSRWHTAQSANGGSAGVLDQQDTHRLQADELSSNHFRSVNCLQHTCSFKATSCIMDRYFSLKGALRAPMGVGPPSCRLSINPWLQNTTYLRTARIQAQIEMQYVQLCSECQLACDNVISSSRGSNRVQVALPKCPPGIKLTLQTFNIGQEVYDVHVCKIFLERNGSCTAQHTLMSKQQHHLQPDIEWKDTKTATVKKHRTSDFRCLCIQQTEIVRATGISGQQVACMHAIPDRPRFQ